MSFTKHILLIIFGAILLQSCCRENNSTYIAQKPIYLSAEELGKSVQATGPMALKKPGKIYFKDNYIYINELYEGIHIIDNTNPAAPQNIGFIKIPGNVDIAIKGKYLYADNVTDLAVLDISNPTQAKEVKRVKEIFPYNMPTEVPKRALPVDRSKGLVVGWKDTIVTQTSDCN